MAKFVVISNKPESLEEGQYLIDRPSFIEQIAIHRSKAPKNGLTGSFHLRMILDSIAQTFDPQNMTAYSVRTNNFEGRPFSSDEQLDSILVEMIKTDYPTLFTKYLDYKIKNRPKNINTILYVNSNIKNQYETFFTNGIDELEEEKKDKTKSTKIVGKPALTKEQAEALKKQADT